MEPFYKCKGEGLVLKGREHGKPCTGSDTKRRLLAERGFHSLWRWSMHPCARLVNIVPMRPCRSLMPAALTAWPPWMSARRCWRPCCRCGFPACDLGFCMGSACMCGHERKAVLRPCCRCGFPACDLGFCIGPSQVYTSVAHACNTGVSSLLQPFACYLFL